MKIYQFTQKFKTEQDCKDFLREKRIAEGLKCKCGCEKLYWFKNQELFKCSLCGTRQNLRAGTIMQDSKLPLMKWFMCINLMTSIKSSMSALEMQRQLDCKRYEPVWAMMNKIRIAMGKREDLYQLKGEIELDDAYYTADNASAEKARLKRGKGSQRKKTALVMAEYEDNPLSNKKQKKSLGFVKIVVTDNMKMNTINYEVQKHIEFNSALHTDGMLAFNKLSTIVEQHHSEVILPELGHVKLPWVHKMISNSKVNIQHIHKSVGSEYLQTYLDEFCYKLNRRYFTDIFDRFLMVAATNKPY